MAKKKKKLGITANNLKGALLEYVVRNLLKSCGFTNVRADGVYIFEKGGLFFVNGRGAAHDADILMDPPIQMPFAYPTRLLFECKAYADDASLPIVRNALGLRNDVNEFEIVTLDSIEQRQNNRRAAYAIEARRRFYYQVGIAVVNDFTKPAYEFAANNKIPLFSLTWFLGASLISSFNSLSSTKVNRIPDKFRRNLYTFLKDRDGDLNSADYESARTLIESDSTFGDMITFANSLIDIAYVGLIETGDLIFLYPTSPNPFGGLAEGQAQGNLKAEIHYATKIPNVWRLTVFDATNRVADKEFEFRIPPRIFEQWSSLNLDKEIALDIKQTFFSRLFIFGKRSKGQPPFVAVTIDQGWLDRARQELGAQEPLN